MAYQPYRTSTKFVSGIGKHNLNSLGKDLKIDEFIKCADNMKNGKIRPDDFIKGAKGIINTQTLVDLGIRVGSGVAIKMIENGINSLSNKDNAKIPLVTSSGITPMGKNTATYQKTHVHLGIETTERLKRIRYNPNIDYAVIAITKITKNERI